MSAPVVNKAALLAIIQPLTGLSVAAVYYDLDSEPTFNGGDAAQVTLRVKVSAPVGDDTRLFDLDGSNTMTVRVVGQRVVRLTLKASVMARDIEASEILDNVRASLMLPSVNDALQALGLGFQMCTATTDVSMVVDDRMENVAIMDILFNAAKVLDAVPVDPAAGVGAGWVQTAPVPLSSITLTP